MTMIGEVTRFTALHRVLGRPPGPLMSDMIDEAIAIGASETTDLDFKAALPPSSGLASTDFPKDVAALANSGGGTIVFGVEEDQKRAVARRDVGALTEGQERTLRSAAVTAISPPVFGLDVARVGAPGQHCVVLTVPASLDGPHLIYRNDYFGAPRRNDADTVWMRERDIEVMYRARFDRQRDAAEALGRLYAHTALGRDTDARAWFVAVGIPRLPAPRVGRMSREQAAELFQAATEQALDLAGRNGGVHPLESVDRVGLRIGMRSWVAPNLATADSARFREAWASVGDSGNATLAAALGGHRSGPNEFWPGGHVEARSLECAVADFGGLLRATASAAHTGEYDVRIGIEWQAARLTMLTSDPAGWPVTSDDRVYFVPVRATLTGDSEDEEFRRQVHEIGLDCVNQGGINDTQAISPPASAS